MVICGQLRQLLWGPRGDLSVEDCGPIVVLVSIRKVNVGREGRGKMAVESKMLDEILRCLVYV